MAITFKTVRVTPALAKKFLESNIEYNRKPKSAKIAAYSSDMKTGLWAEDTGETVKVTPEGRMIDGQNRMWAVIDSGVTVTMTVAYGVPEKNVQVIDTGASRSFADAARLQQIPFATGVGAIVRRVLIWERGGRWTGITKASTGGGTGLNALRPTIAAQMMRYKEDVPTFDAAVRRASDMRSQKLSKSYIPPGVAYYLFKQVDAEQTENFFDRLVSGANVGELDPIRHLRNRLIRTNDALDYLLALYIVTWNYWREDKEIDRIRLPWKGDLNNLNFPVPK